MNLLFHLRALPRLMDLRRGFARGFVSVVFLSLGLVLSLLAKETNEFKPDLEQIALETTKTLTKEGRIYSVTWFPDEFWKLSFEKGGQNPAMADEFMKILRPYVIFAAAGMETDAKGDITFLPEDYLVENIVLSDSQGRRYVPLEEDMIDDRVKGLFALMKPVLSMANREVGENMHFLFFQGIEDDVKIADPLKEGRLQIDLGRGDSVHWRLPLGALYPPRYCRKCAESYNGSYRYCPYDGHRLSEKKL